MTSIEQRLTADEEAILRSWLAGNDITDIARAKKMDKATVSTLLVDLCGMDRPRGRRILNTGTRTSNTAGNAGQQEVRQRLEAEVARLRTAYDAALTDIEQIRGQLDELAADARVATQARDQALADLHRRPKPPEPLDEYWALRCPECRWVGFGAHHHQPLTPVTVAIQPRKAE